MQALALLFVLGQALDQPPPVRHHAASVGDGFVLFDAISFPDVSRGYTTPERACIQGKLTGHRCLACGFGLFDGGCQLQCGREDGGVSAAVISDPGGTCHRSGIAGELVREIDRTNFPTMYDDGGLSDWFERDGGMVAMWGFARGTGPSGLDYWLDDNNDTGRFMWRENSGTMEWFQSSSVTPIDGFNTFTELNRLGLGMWTLRYTGGVDVGGGAAAIYVENYNGAGPKYGKDNGIGPPGSDCGSPWYFGSRRAADLDLGGVMGGVTWVEGKVTNDEQADLAQAFWSMPRADAGSRWTTSLGYPLGIDNTARGGNVDMANSLGFLVSPEGLQGVDSQATNWMAANPTSFEAMPTTGTGFVTAGVSRGPLADFYNASECDRLTNTSGATNFCVWSLDAGIAGGTKWWNGNGYLRASDGGTGTVNRVLFDMQSDGTWSDGGHHSVCDFTGLVYGVNHPECRSQLTGGTYAVLGICVPPNSTIDACYGQWNNAVALEPASLSTQVLSAGVQYHANAPSSWPQPDAGAGRLVGVFEIPYDPITDWSTNLDVIYPLDTDQRGTYGLVDHVVVMAYGYTAPTIELITVRDGSTLCGSGTCDYQIHDVPTPRFHTVGTAIEWSASTANGTKATSKVKQADCGIQPAGLSAAAGVTFSRNCAASVSTVLATNNNPDAGAPAPFGHITVTGRNGSTVVSTNKAKAVELFLKR